MPLIETRTANPKQAVTSTAPVSPEAYGSEGFQGLSNLGRSMQAIAEKIQHQQDETDLIEHANNYRVYLATLPDDIISDDTIKPEHRTATFRARSIDKLSELQDNLRPALQRALQNHVKPMMADGEIHMQQADIVERIGFARASLAKELNKNADARAMAMASGDQQGAQDALMLQRDVLARAEERRTLTPEERVKADGDATHRTFELLAEQNPMLTIQLTDDVKAGKKSEDGMDAPKAQYYSNLAYNELHRRELLVQQEEMRRATQAEHQALAAKSDYYQKFTEVDDNGVRLHSTEELLRQAGKDMVLQNHKDETVTFLQSMLAHERSASNSPVDWTFYNNVILPNIYKGKYKTELDVLKAGSEKLGAHMGTAIAAFQSYRSIVTDKIKQDYGYGYDLIHQTFAPLPGQQIDPMGVKETGIRAQDRYRTWYSALVDRAKTEGPQVFKGIDFQDVARKIKDEEYQTLQDNVIKILESSKPKYQTEGDIQKDFKGGKITWREVNMYLQQLENYQELERIAATKKTAAPSPGGRIEKK